MLPMTSESKHLSIVIERPTSTVYEYVADPANLLQWAAGLASTTVEQVEGQWVANSPMGRVTVDSLSATTLACSITSSRFPRARACTTRCG